jgi:Tfp pilus assembly protein PilV
MQVNKDQSGVAPLESLLLIVIVGIIGFAGYKIHQTRHNLDAQNAAQTAASHVPLSKETASSLASAPRISSSTDLNKVEQSLNSVNPNDDNSDISQLDSQAGSLNQ